jgi:hypothetical protein
MFRRIERKITTINYDANVAIFVVGRLSREELVDIITRVIDKATEKNIYIRFGYHEVYGLLREVLYALEGDVCPLNLVVLVDTSISGLMALLKLMMQFSMTLVLAIEGIM